jgi:hypothetical protein
MFFKNNFRHFLLVWLVSQMVGACSATGLQAAPPGLTLPPLKPDQIKNMKVELVAQDSHAVVQLTDGKYQSASDPSSRDYAAVTLLEQRLALGDLNGDGAGDAAVLLAENYGGTGTFVSVVALLNDDGKPVQAGAYMVDDRPVIKALRISERRIVLDGDIYGWNDPACCAAFPVSEILQLTKNGLTLQRLVSIAPGGSQRSIAIESPTTGTRVDSASVEIKGSFTSSPFENTRAYHVYDGSGNELTAGPILVKGEPGSSGTFDAPIDLTAIPAGTLLRLEISDLSAADGSPLAMDSVDLMIE